MAALMGAALRVSDSVVDDYIRVWRFARTYMPVRMSAWSSISLLWRLMRFGVDGVAAIRGFRPSTHMDYNQIEKDAELVQGIVDKMPAEIKTSFEAYHIAVIRDELCRDMPHKARANILGIPASTYFTRVQAGWHYLADRLPAGTASL
jgi:hypothetical protein